MPLPGEIPPPPPTTPMPPFPPPGGGSVPPPPGPPSGPFPGPGPGPGPFPGPIGPPPGGGSNSTPLILAIVGVIAVIGIIFAVVSGGDDDDDGTAIGNTPGAQTDDGDGSDGSDDPGGVPLPDGLDDDNTDTSEPEETLPPVTDPPLQPAEASVSDCVSVDSAGTFLGTGSCSEGGATYEVIEVVEEFESCSSIGVGEIVSGDYRLCLQPHLLETYCYDFGLDANDVMNGWITPAGECELPGTVHVIDIVPGITDNGSDYCTTDYEWDLWYSFDLPQMVVCIKKY